MFASLRLPDPDPDDGTGATSSTDPLRGMK